MFKKRREIVILRKTDTLLSLCSGKDSLDFFGFLTLPPTTSRLQFPIVSLPSFSSVFNAVPRWWRFVEGFCRSVIPLLPWLYDAWSHSSNDVSYLGRVVEVSLSFASILLISSSLVTRCVLVTYWLAWSELSVKKRKKYQQMTTRKFEQSALKPFLLKILLSQKQTSISGRMGGWKTLSDNKTECITKD